MQKSDNFGEYLVVMRLILSTIGTSLLTHKVNGQKRSLLNKYASYSLNDIPKLDITIINNLIERSKMKLKKHRNIITQITKS